MQSCCSSVGAEGKNRVEAHVMPVEGQVDGHHRADDEELDAPEEVRPVRTLPRPTTPTQEEIDKHNIDHLPYRDWCPYCVEAFGRERAHPVSYTHLTLPTNREV